MFMVVCSEEMCISVPLYSLYADAEQCRCFFHVVPTVLIPLRRFTDHP